jgi:hypothetical protein
MGAFSACASSERQKAMIDRTDGSGPAADSSSKSVAGNNARQGVTGHGVRYVLFFGLFGAVAAFIALAFSYAG